MEKIIISYRLKVLRKKIANQEFLEWAKVHDYYYGTEKKNAQEAFAQQKNMLLVIDVQGGASIRKIYPEQSVLIFILPPSLEEAKNRLLKRGTESSGLIRKRLSVADQEISSGSWYDFKIVNQDFEKAYSELSQIIRQKLSE